MYIIWHDNDFDFALWVYENSALRKEQVLLKPIPKTNSKSQILSKLTDRFDYQILPAIKLESPDIIVQKIVEDESKIIFVTEFMTHTPQWQHPAQRFARIYSSSLLGIPVALVLNQKKVKYEKRYSEYRPVVYTCSPSVYRLFVTTSQLSNSPALLFFWPDLDGFPINDTRHATAPALLPSIKDWLSFLNAAIANNGSLSLQDAVVSKQLKVMETFANTPHIDDFTSIEGISDTDALLQSINAKSVPQRILDRKKSFVFGPDGLCCASSSFRTDPYAGMLCAFDNMFCRDSQYIRKYNLVLHAKGVPISSYSQTTSSHNYEECPFITGTTLGDITHFDSCPFTMAKYRRIYGEVADMIIFDDGIFYSNRGSI